MHNAICLWDGCDRPSFARGLCGRCHMRARRAGTIHLFSAPDRACDHCGGQFQTAKNGKHKFCSAECQRLSVEAERVRKRLALTSDRSCERCGERFGHDRRSDSRHCSLICQQAAWYDREADRLRMAARSWATSNREKRNEYEHKRRAIQYGVAAESIDRDELWSSSDGRCAICGADIDPAERFPAPLSPSVDHIMPLSRGGSHARANVQLVHLRCNLRKGAKVPSSQEVI